MSNVTVPLFNGAVAEDAVSAAVAVLRSGQIASGSSIQQFEREIAKRVRREHIVSTRDMTSALALALQLSGVKEGDDVVTLAFSCLSSNSPIAHIGARAIWVDIDPTSGTMDLLDFERSLTQRTKAVFLYHVAGYPGRAREVAAICHSRGIKLIEDCNNALTATCDGEPVGQHGDFAVWSFYPNRQINAIEGGALACPDLATAIRASRLRRFGIEPAGFRDTFGEISPLSDVAEIGGSDSLNQLNAAVGLAHIEKLDKRIEQTEANVAKILDSIQGFSRLSIVHPLPGARPAYWGLLVRADARDDLLALLKSTGVHCSKLHHRNDTYSGFKGDRRSLPGTDRWMAEILALPCGWWLQDFQIAHMLAVLRSACN